MIEVTGNLWEFEADAHVITTNGFVKKSGECVMGRGCAKEARDMFPGLAKRLGERIDKHGNHVHLIGSPKVDSKVKNLVSFPVKHNWWENADPLLIHHSAVELVTLAEQMLWEKVVLPRPGCGNGSLEWEEVSMLLMDELDNRFYVITWG